MSENDQDRRDERLEQRQERRDIRKDERDARTPISENTPIRLGFLIAIFGSVVTTVFLLGWWASRISFNQEREMGMMTEIVHTLSDMRSKETADFNVLSLSIADIQTWRKVIDVAGSPTVALKLDVLNSKLEKLSQELSIHEAKDSKYQKQEP